MGYKLVATVLALAGTGCATLFQPETRSLQPGVSLAPPGQQAKAGRTGDTADTGGSYGTVGAPISGTANESLVRIGAQVAFDHGCPQERIRLIRSHFYYLALTTLDLDVCGVVRRYKVMEQAAVDVTGSYPPASLPAPPPPIR
jgi:hypothetical protein